MKHLARPVLLLLTACGLVAGCDNDHSRDSEPPPRYSAELTRTSYGIPHIRAEDWGSLGYGYGYAYAQDNFCVTMREIVFATGRSAEFLGEAAGDPASDFVFRFLNGSRESFRQRFVDALPARVRELGTGFSAGMNRYLRETGRSNLPEGAAGCRNAEWVYEIDDVDLWMYLRRHSLRLSSDQSLLRQGIFAAEGPSAAVRTATGPVDWSPVRRRLRSLAPELVDLGGGSNGIAVGRDASQTGAGLLLGNPHQPWNGSGRWYEVHLTLPGEYDVAGAALQGLPVVGVGFNRDLAWTHTVSFSSHFTLYELLLNPADPMQYRYGDEWRSIEKQTVTIDVRREDGSLEQREHSFYVSHYGPVVNLREVDPLLDGWPMLTGTVLALRDANLDTGGRAVEQWIRMGQARNIAEFTEALKTIANPLFHTLAADRNGEAFYGEISVVPHVTRQQLDACVNGIVGRLLAGATNNALLALDGSSPGCEWGEDPDSPAGTKLYGYEARPKILTTDYVANSNNSYWLSDAANPLTGYPIVMGWLGHEGQQQFLRTRLTHLMVAGRKAGSDGLDDSPGFNLANLRALMFANRVYGAELVLEDVLALCTDIDAGMPEGERALRACEVLEQWDRKVDPDSRGAQVFTEFWHRIRAELADPFSAVIESDEFWTVDFDPTEPLTTPRGVDLAIDANRVLVLRALAEAVAALDAAAVPLAAPWREVQFYPRNAENIPIHGGADMMGVFNAISVPLGQGGYFDIEGGSSYIQAVTWDETDCPLADTILSHSQSTDPASEHYGDQTALFARKEWVRFPYCQADIDAQQIGRVERVEE
jgi:acyl-homoserine-lactone acylase